MPDTDSFIDLHFPLAGIDQTTAYDQQPSRQTQAGTATTSSDGDNVRAFEPTTDRARGGSRPGLVKWMDDVVANDTGSKLIQEMNFVVTQDYEALDYFIPDTDDTEALDDPSTHRGPKLNLGPGFRPPRYVPNYPRLGGGRPIPPGGSGRSYPRQHDNTPPPDDNWYAAHTAGSGVSGVYKGALAGVGDDISGIQAVRGMPDLGIGTGLLAVGHKKEPSKEEFFMDVPSWFG